jgi:hypothetical protein
MLEPALAYLLHSPRKYRSGTHNAWHEDPRMRGARHGCRFWCPCWVPSLMLWSGTTCTWSRSRSSSYVPCSPRGVAGIRIDGACAAPCAVQRSLMDQHHQTCGSSVLCSCSPPPPFSTATTSTINISFVEKSTTPKATDRGIPRPKDPQRREAIKKGKMTPATFPRDLLWSRPPRPAKPALLLSAAKKNPTLPSCPRKIPPPRCGETTEAPGSREREPRCAAGRTGTTPSVRPARGVKRPSSASIGEESERRGARPG